MTKRAFLPVFVLIVGLAVRPAIADSIFALTFNSVAYTGEPSGTVDITATVINTGTTTLTRWQTAGFTYTPFINLYRTDQIFPTVSFQNTFSSSSTLLPGQSVTFDFVLLFYENALPGNYDLFSSANLQLVDSSGRLTPIVFGSNLPTIEIVPEPSTITLLAAGLMGAWSVSWLQAFCCWPSLVWRTARR